MVQSGRNTFYANAEANAFDILQQMMMKESQRSAQQILMELAAMKALFSQGQFLFCIPLGINCQSPCLPFSWGAMYGFSGASEALYTPDHRQAALPPQPTPVIPTSPPSPATTPTKPHINQQSIVHVNFKNGCSRATPTKPGSDDCNLGKDGISVAINLGEYLPAEIIVEVEEKALEVKANHVDSHGIKTFSRKYDLPACMNVETVTCFLTHDGFLMFSAAWCKME